MRLADYYRLTDHKFLPTDNIDERSCAVEAINQRLGYSGWPETKPQTVWFIGQGP